MSASNPRMFGTNLNEDGSYGTLASGNNDLSNAAKEPTSKPASRLSICSILVALVILLCGAYFLTSEQDSFHEVIVLGLGPAGLGSAYELSKQTPLQKNAFGFLKQSGPILGLEQNSESGASGSSSYGRTRLYRKSTVTNTGDKSSDPLAFSIERWRELEQASGLRILSSTGLLNFGPSDSPVFGKAIAACKANPACEEITGEEIVRRFPGFKNGKVDKNSADYTGLADGSGGTIDVRNAFDAFRNVLNTKQNVRLRFDARVLSVAKLSEEQKKGNRKHLADKNYEVVYEKTTLLGFRTRVVAYAKQLVVALGPYTKKFVSDNMRTLNLAESDYDRHIGQVQVIEQEGYNISPQKPASDLGLPDSFFEYTPRVTEYTGPCMTVYGYQEAGDSLEYSFKLHDLQKGQYEHESFTLKSGEKKPLAEKKTELRGNGGAVIESKFPQLKAHFIELFPTLLKNDLERSKEAVKTPARSGDGDEKFALKRNPLCWYSVSHSGWGGPESGKGPQFGYSSFEDVFFNFAFNGSGFKFAPDHGRKAAEFVESRRSEL